MKWRLLILVFIINYSLKMQYNVLVLILTFDVLFGNSQSNQDQAFGMANKKIYIYIQVLTRKGYTQTRQNLSLWRDL